MDSDRDPACIRMEWSRHSLKFTQYSIFRVWKVWLVPVVNWLTPSKVIPRFFIWVARRSNIFEEPKSDADGVRRSRRLHLKSIQSIPHVNNKATIDRINHLLLIKKFVLEMTRTEIHVQKCQDEKRDESENKYLRCDIDRTCRSLVANGIDRITPRVFRKHSQRSYWDSSRQHGQYSISSKTNRVHFCILLLIIVLYWSTFTLQSA
jgi:hypothetical protein